MGSDPSNQNVINRIGLENGLLRGLSRCFWVKKRTLIQRPRERAYAGFSLFVCCPKNSDLRVFTGREFNNEVQHLG